MSCDAIESMLALYIDNALTPMEFQQVEAHLETCQGCQSLLAELRENQTLLRSLPLVLPPGSFREDLLFKVTSQQQRKKPALKYLLPRLSSLAAALLVVLLTSNLYLFPAIWPEQPAEDLGKMRTMMFAAPEADPQAGDATEEQTNGALFNAAGSEAPEEDNTPNYWLWSGVASLGLFGLGSGYFVYRYRHI